MLRVSSEGLTFDEAKDDIVGVLSSPLRGLMSSTVNGRENEFPVISVLRIAGYLFIDDELLVLL